ncbi:MAG: STAS domain-containing protein [Planctomycetota bacterium]|nr:STAS domain-containing protein [Planctomycetota bacterium]
MDVVVITFDGEIADFPLLVQSVDNLIADGTRHLVIDLHTLPFINSAALGYLVKARANLERKQGEMALSRVQPAIRNILEMTGLDEVFPAFGSAEEAVAYLGGDSTADAPADGKRAVRHSNWR